MYSRYGVIPPLKGSSYIQTTEESLEGTGWGLKNLDPEQQVSRKKYKQKDTHHE